MTIFVEISAMKYTDISQFFQILCFITEALGLHIRKVGKCSTKNLPIILGVLVVAEWKQI